jgi:hypothetical protein
LIEASLVQKPGFTVYELLCLAGQIVMHAGPLHLPAIGTCVQRLAAINCAQRR